jgi:hypothetical protein
MTPEIKQFLKQMLIDAGQTDLNEAVEEQMLQDLNTRLEDRLILTAMQQLPAAKQIEFEKMTEEKMDPGMRTATLETFLKENIPNYEQVFTAALIDFRNLYVEGSK